MKHINECACGCGHSGVADITCDICGKSCQTECGTIIDGNSYEYAELSAFWGYASDFDEENHSMHICVACYKDMPNPWRDKVVRKERACMVGYTGREVVGLDADMWEETSGSNN